MDVSVIIVNFKTADLIADCINSVIEKTIGVSYDVIVVDNNSEADFEEKILKVIPESLQDNFQFIALPENVGFGRANNEGLKIAKGRNVFFLNPDTVLINNAIKILSDFLNSHPKAGACGGNLYDEHSEPSFSFQRWLPGTLWELDQFFNSRPRKLVYGKSDMHNFTGKIISVGFISGADLMVKRSILDEIGGFSPEFFMYYEESDLCARIKKAGYKIYSVPEARIIHLESKSFQSDGAWQSERKTIIFEESRKTYYRRNTSGINRAFANFIYDLNLLSRILLIRNPSKKEYYRLRRKWFRE